MVCRGWKTVDGLLLGGMGELFESVSLRSQMAVDRRFEFMSALSRVMKKVSTTRDVLVHGIK